MTNSVGNRSVTQLGIVLLVNVQYIICQIRGKKETFLSARCSAGWDRELRESLVFFSFFFFYTVHPSRFFGPGESEQRLAFPRVENMRKKTPILPMGPHLHLVISNSAITNNSSITVCTLVKSMLVNA